MARPVKQIDPQQFEALCAMMASKKEICSVLLVTDKTLDAWCKRTYGVSYAEAYEQKSSNGKIRLRRYQLQLAERNAAMAIWLGKQWLGQTDREIVQVQEIEKDPLTLAFEALEDKDE